MFDLDEINKNDLTEKTKVEPFGDIYIRLITESELDDLMLKSVDEQISYCVLDENGEKHFPDSNIVKSKMKLKHKDDIINQVMKINRFGISFEENVKK